VGELLRIGALRHQVTIQSYTKSRDSYGGEVETWTDLHTGVWASVEPLIGREYLAAKQVQAEVSHKVRMRYIAGLLPAMRIVWGTRTFEIESILNVQERNRELVIMATEDV
jgi:SPP1 family predicted phage head-tail adaptor